MQSSGMLSAISECCARQQPELCTDEALWCDLWSEQIMQLA